jgi:monofunctional biosynthetic peptidoglycan transglycosylase
MPMAGSDAQTTNGTGATVEEQKTLIDFSDADSTRWFPIHDVVMGGVSEGGIRRTDKATGVFSGSLSLENNGGFASVRAALGRRDLSAYAGLEIRVRGDGRTYQLRLRTDGNMDSIAYRAEFATTTGEWTTIQIPFDDFVPTFRGRLLSDVDPLDTSHIHQLAFMLADKNPGQFSLEIDFVRTWAASSIGE